MCVCVYVCVLLACTRLVLVYNSIFVCVRVYVWGVRVVRVNLLYACVCVCVCVRVCVHVRMCFACSNSTGSCV